MVSPIAAASENLKKARQEDVKQRLRDQWYADRKEAIHDQVTAHDVLQRNGMSLRGSDSEEQISCPFHGQDLKPSARIYPEVPGCRSHVWCYACKERWDCIGLWIKYTGATFNQALQQLEATFGVQRPPFPEELRDGEDSEDPFVERFHDLIKVCENRLRTERRSFDLETHLTLGALIDRITHYVVKGNIAPEVGVATAQKLLDKIGVKIRGGSSPDETT